MHLGDKLKLYRKGKDLDQRQMADILLIGYRTYQEIERTGIVTKAKVAQDIRQILAGNEQILAPKEQEMPSDKDRTISDQAYSIRKLTDTNAEMVQLHREFLEKIFSSLKTSDEVFAPSRPKGKSSKRRGIGELQDKQETHSEESHHQQKGI